MIISPATKSTKSLISTSARSGAGRRSSAGPRALVEDHRLLPDLHFAVPKIAGALVDVQDGSGGGLPCFHQPEAARDRAFSEQALAGAQNHGELPEAQRIDQVVPEQGLQKVAAAVDLDLAAFLCL